MRRSALLPAAFLLATHAACGRDQGTTMDGSTVAALQMPVTIPAADLPDPASEGARLVTRYCAQCHGIPSPRSHSAQDWVPTFRRMLLQMEHSDAMGNMASRRGGPMGMMGAGMPSVARQRVLLAYLQAYGLQAAAENSLPEPESPAATLFRQTCARCHALPAPGQHTGSEWPGVVARMRQHMTDLKVAAVPDSQATVLVRYLQSAAGGS